MVIQHPGGKVERLHGPAKVGEVMRGNPGHYVRSWSSASPRLIPAAAAGRSQGHQGEAHRAPGHADVTLQGACHPSFRGSLFLVARFLRSGGDAS